MSLYKGFGARPELIPLRDGILDIENMTPEQGAHMRKLTQGYPSSSVLDASQQAFVGITTDGKPMPGLFSLQDTGLDSKRIVAAAGDLWSVLDLAERNALSEDVDSTAWRRWTNAFPSAPPHGIRLQDLPQVKRDAILAVIRETLSTQGFTQLRDVMRLNAKLGQVIDQYHDSLTEWMYWFTVFGQPSINEPWGWQIHGHHLDVSCMIVGRQLVLTPTFLGAELESDALFPTERAFALDLVNSLSANQASEAVVYRTFRELPHELQSPLDGRHLAGAGKDNRVIPYEGLGVGNLLAQQHKLFRRLVEAWLGRMRDGPVGAAVADIEKHLDKTYFAWYGQTSDDAAFYYRIHSPVVLIEYDNHPGIFLNNEEPEPFHVHTVSGRNDKDNRRRLYRHYCRP